MNRRRDTDRQRWHLRSWRGFAVVFIAAAVVEAIMLFTGWAP